VFRFESFLIARGRSQPPPDRGRRRGSVAALAIATTAMIAGIGARQGTIVLRTEVSEQEAQGFVGAETCAECHASVYEAWSASTHGLAGGPPTEALVLPSFDGTPIRFADATVIPSVSPNAEYQFTIERVGRPPVVFRVDGVIGGGHMLGGGTQGFVSRMPDGTVRFLPFDFVRDEGRWFCNTSNIVGWWVPRAAVRGGRLDRGWIPISEALRLADCGDWPPVRTLGTNTTFANCQQCHGSQIVMSLDSARSGYSTTFTSLTINCESCHGPGRSHVDMARDGRIPSADSPELGLVSLATLDEEASVDVCLWCHAVKRSLTPGYLPGETFGEFYSLLGPLLDGSPFHPDGRVRTFAYQQNHKASSCYLDGSMTCVDCHDPHAGSYRDIYGQALDSPFADGQCLDCHASKADDPEAHTNHPADSDGARCVSCHMPYLQHPNVGSEIRFARSDHTIGIPRPRLDERLGITGACASCHADRSSEQLESQIRAWYGALKPHRDLVGALLADSQAGARPIDATLLTEDAGPMALATVLSAMLENRGGPGAVVIDSAESEALWKLSVHDDLDVRSLALAVLALGGAIDSARQTLPRLLNGMGTDSGAVSARMVMIYRVVGDRHLRGGDIASAISVYNHALELQPQNAGVIADLGAAYQASGDATRAAELFRRSLAIDSTQSQIWVNLGVVHERTNREADALQSYRRAIAVNPGEVLAHFNLGNFHFLRGEYSQAIGFYRTAVGHDPGFADAHLLLAQTYLLTGKPDSALLYVRNALDFDPNNAGAGRMFRDLTAR